MSDNIDELLKQLNEPINVSSLTNEPSSAPIKIDDENVNEFIMEQTSKLVDSGMRSLGELRTNLQDAESIASYAELFRSVTTSLDILNKINIQNKKDKNSRELEQIKAGRVKGPTNNTNVLIATREEIIKTFMNKIAANNKTEIDINSDVEVKEIKDVNE